ncbi:MAG: hypothetical protein AB7S75_23275 [Desulfococcaceae bacterium]
MPGNAKQYQCIYYIYDGLRGGLSHFSQPSRVALIYTTEPDSPIRIYDPQFLLRGHEPRLRELYLDSDQWRKKDFFSQKMKVHEVEHEKNLQLTGLISFGVVSSDRPVSVIQGGVELTARCEWRPLRGYMSTPPRLEEYIK